MQDLLGAFHYVKQRTWVFISCWHKSYHILYRKAVPFIDISPKERKQEVRYDQIGGIDRRCSEKDALNYSH